MSAIFFYGSLRDHGLLEIVLGRPVDPSHLGPARAEGFTTLRLADGACPMLVPAPGRQAEGVLFHHAAEADLAGAGGLHGLACEGEDIRTMVLGFDEAMAAVEAGAVNTAIALVSLLWLAANRQRLRDEWGEERGAFGG